MALSRIQKAQIAADAINAAKLDTILNVDIADGQITTTQINASAAIAATKIGGLATSATTDTTNADNIGSGTIPNARLDTGTTANKLVLIDGTGKIPAVDGSLLTGIVGATKSSSDPTISTNPSGGVGTEWHNTSTGEMYICTDATTGENVWTNVGAGTDDVAPWYYGGAQYGYACAGYPNNDLIEKFSFTTDGNSTDVGNLTVSRHAVCGNSSTTHGFACGGSPTQNTIDKWTFATDGNAVDHGNLSRAVAYPTEPGSASTTHGYTAGGSGQNVIDKFVFATDSNATDVGDLNNSNGSAYGHTSSTHGYAARNDIIDKYSFATDGNATDVGALSTADAKVGAGTSSDTHGYSSGAESYTGAHGNVIDKYSFATAGTATDVGDLTQARGNCCGQSSRTYGYTSGGDGGANRNIIDKFSFTTDGNATDVGDLITARGYMGGQHY